MLRRTFLSLLGAVAWPWSKRQAVSEFTLAGGRITSVRRLGSHGFYFRIYPPVAIADHTAKYTSEYRFGYTTPDGVFHGERYSEAAFRAAQPGI